MFDSFPNPFEFYQLVGWVGALLSIVSFQLLSPKNTLFVRVLSGLFFGVHYWGLAAAIACLVCFVGSFRDVLTIYLKKKALDKVLIFYVIAFWAITLVIGNSVDDYLIAMATSLVAASAYYRDCFWRFRWLTFAHHALWIVAAIIMTSYPGLVVVFLSMLSNLVGMVRYKLKEKHSL